MTLTVNNISMPIDSTPEDAKGRLSDGAELKKEKITGVHIKNARLTHGAEQLISCIPF